MGNQGRFVWHDLMSKDVGASAKFYGELFGWRMKKSEKGPYTHISAGDQMIGGMLPFDKPGMPPHWIGYVSTDRIADTVARAEKKGAKVYAPVTTLPDVGSFAVLADPTGGVFAPFTSAHDMPESTGQPQAGTFCWDELCSTDPQTALDFYSHVFGWSHEVGMDMGPMGKYHLFKREVAGQKQNAGGLMKPTPQMPQLSHWLSYVAVTDADATCDQAKRLGATVFSSPMDIPNVGRFAVFGDNVGAALGILAPIK
jgi:predicted enzyme related to lactoylglutathione lyase